MAKARRSDRAKQLHDLRKKAEQLVSTHIADRHAPAPEEVQRLVHELQVHQAELEMQNEELREAQGQLEASRDRYADLYDFAPVGYVSLDARGLILDINLTAAKLLGKERGRLVRHPFAPYVVEMDRSDFREHLNRCAGGQKEATCEVGLLAGDGMSIPVQLHSVLAQDPETKESLCRTVITDISQRKQAEDRVAAYQRRLRSLGAKVAMAEEQERRRIATGLHDNVVQALALAKMKLEDLAHRKPAARLAPVLREVRDLVAQSIDDTRTLLFDLSPVTLYELGFEPAVESFLHHIQEAHRLATRFRTDGLPKPMTNDVRVVLFRGVREVLQNVVMHAQARSVGVSVRREDETAHVEVQDDGVGFDTEKVLSVHEEAGGFGLFDMRERLDYLGGSLTIQSDPGKGTTVVLRVPLASEKACPGGMSHGDSSASG